MLTSTCVWLAFFSAYLPGSGGPGAERTERLSGFLDPAVSVQRFVLAPDGSRLGLVERPVGPSARIWSVPVSDPSQAVEISSQASWFSGGAFSPDSTTLFFTALDVGLDLFAVPAEGGVAPIRLAPGPTNLSNLGTATRVEASVDGARVMHVYNTGYPGYQSGVAIAPADGSAPAVFGPGAFEASLRAEFDGSGAHVAVLGGSLDRGQLHWVTSDGSEARLNLGGFALDVRSFGLLEPTGFVQPVLFDAQPAFVPGLRRLYRVDVPLHGPGRVLRDPLLARRVLTTTDASVVAFALTPDRRQALIVDDMGVLARAPVDASAAAVPLAQLVSAAGSFFLPDGDVLRTTPDGSRVVFSARNAQGQSEVFGVSTNGGPVVRLSRTSESGLGVIVSSVKLGPDGGRVLFRAHRGSLFRTDLFSAPVDGSGLALNLSTLPSTGDVQPSFVFLADSTAVVYLADRTDGVDELWLAPLDASRPARRVSRPLLQPGSDVLPGFQVAGEWVYYVADAETDGREELYRSRLFPTPAAAGR